MVCIHSFYSCLSLLLFAVSPVSGLSRRQALSPNVLEVVPRGPHHMPVGRNVFFTCKAVVHNPELVRDLKWVGPNGKMIPQDDR